VRKSLPPSKTDARSPHAGEEQNSCEVFPQLRRRLTLIDERWHSASQRAMLLVGIAWGIPLLLSFLHGASVETTSLPYLADVGAWSKFFVAIGCFVLSEQSIEAALGKKLHQALSEPLRGPSSCKVAAEAVNKALRRRDAKWPDLICLALAAIASLLALRHLSAATESSWSANATPAGNAISAAGWWSVCVSIPMFWFLMLKGIWWHLNWSLLMRDVARMKLRLIAMHPDRRGGIGFLADYPNAYTAFVFGVSCSMAAGLSGVIHETTSIKVIGILMAGWLLIVLLQFAFPLFAFTSLLADLKRETLASLSAQASRYHRAVERKLIGANITGGTDPEIVGQAIIQDPDNAYEATKKLSTTLFDRRTVLPVSAAAILPFLIPASTAIPYDEVFAVLKKLLLI
jgi:hypothetical protein